VSLRCTHPFQRSLCWLLGGAAAAALSVQAARAAELADLVREQHAVQVNGAFETWKLEWETLPASACGPDDVSVALACPCSGFAYGEAGHLSLVRLRPGATRELLDLTGFYRHEYLPVPGNLAVLQRWLPVPATAHDEDDDWHHASDLNFLSRVRARGAANVMRIGDFNHDGQASEFLVQVGAQGCGRHLMVLVGVSKYNKRLHVFASAEAPDLPLELDAQTWEAVRRNAGPIRVLESRCDGQPGQSGQLETEVSVEARHGIFHVQRAAHPCAGASTDAGGAAQGAR
jgi:hypothetical protein